MTVLSTLDRFIERLKNNLERYRKVIKLKRRFRTL
jgi:preprotein translocase subunit Sss1